MTHPYFNCRLRGVRFCRGVNTESSPFVVANRIGAHIPGEKVHGSKHNNIMPIDNSTLKKLAMIKDGKTNESGSL